MVGFLGDRAYFFEISIGGPPFLVEGGKSGPRFIR